MRLLRVELRNWCQFEHFAQDFSPGMTAIIGQNGSGKSNILGGISWLLTGENPNDGVKVDNIRQGAAETEASYGILTFDHFGQTFRVHRHLRPARTKATLHIDGQQVALGDDSVTAMLAERLQLSPKVVNRFVIVAQADMYGFLDATDAQVDQFFQKLFDTGAATECVKVLAAAAGKVLIPQTEPSVAIMQRLQQTHGQISLSEQMLLHCVALADPAADQRDYGDINAAEQRPQLESQLAAAINLRSTLANDLANKEAELLQLTTDRDTLQQAVTERTTAANSARAAMANWSTYQALTQQRLQIEQGLQQLAQEAATHQEPSRPKTYLEINMRADFRSQISALSHQIGILRGDLVGYSPENLAACQAEAEQHPEPVKPADYGAPDEQVTLIGQRARIQQTIQADEHLINMFGSGTSCKCPTCRTTPEQSQMFEVIQGIRDALPLKQTELIAVNQRLDCLQQYDAAKQRYDGWLRHYTPRIQKLTLQSQLVPTLQPKLDQYDAMEELLENSVKYGADLATYQAWKVNYDQRLQSLQQQQSQLALLQQPAVVDAATLQQTVRTFDEFQQALVDLGPALNGLQGQVSQLRTNHGVQAGRVQALEQQLAAIPTAAAAEQARQRVQLRQQTAAARAAAQADIQAAQVLLQSQQQQLATAQRIETEARVQIAWLERLEQIRAILQAAPQFVAQHNLQLLQADTDMILNMFDTKFRVESDEGRSFTAHFQDGRVQPAKRLSGGQKVALAMGFRVAINSLFASKVGLLGLDEPTAFLDKQRIRALGPVITKLRELTASRGLQCLIVTHEEDLAPLFDATIRVGPPTVMGQS